LATLGTTTNKTLVKGNPLTWEFKNTSTSVVPGSYVQFTTSDVEITIGGAPTGTKALGIGVVSYEHTHAQYKDGHTISSAFADDDFVVVILRGAGVLVKAQVVANLYRGSVLTGQTSDDALNTGTIGTSDVAGILMEDGPSAGLAKVLLL